VRKKTNSRKDKFLSSIPVASFDSKNDLIAGKCKFNFSYMDKNQDAGQDFRDWNHEQLYKLLDKLQNYCKQPLKYWNTQRVGGGSNKVFEIYGEFPRKSEFIHPKHVPHDARWARFRMEGAMRLVGFIVPDELQDCECKHTKIRFDTNTFYIVFLDANHKFYITK